MLKAGLMLVVALSLTLPPGSGLARTTGASQPADSVYRHGRIYTVDSAFRQVEAVAIRDGRFVHVGSDEEVRSLIGPETEVFDLAGHMAMPGIYDMHAHPLMGGFQNLYECTFPIATPLHDILERVRACAQITPRGEWIRGGQWATQILSGDSPPNRTLLDDVAPDHPVFIVDSSLHNAWLNTRALQALGITAGSMDPEGGVIQREPGTRTPSGILIDNARVEATRALPVRSPAQYQAAVKSVVANFNQLGVVGLKDALADGHSVRAYAAVDRAGQLTMRMATSRPWRTSTTESHAEEMRNLRNWAADATPRVHTGFAKIFVDGIPPTRTAVLIDPYLADESVQPTDDPHFHPDYRGELQHAQADLNAAVTTLDALGLTVKLHATGDGAVRAALDAIAAARKANGNTGLRHEIAHAGMIAEVDQARFRPLDVVAELSPNLWYGSALTAAMERVLGRERTEAQWPIRNLLRQHIPLIYGSDWPSVAPTPSPWPAIEAMVTRRDPYADTPQALGPEQAIPLAEVLRIFTRNGAEAMRIGDESGSIEVGKTADMIVLNQNLFEVPVEQISQTLVLKTLIDGRVVNPGETR